MKTALEKHLLFASLAGSWQWLGSLTCVYGTQPCASMVTQPPALHLTLFLGRCPSLYSGPPLAECGFILVNSIYVEYLQVKSHSEAPCRKECGEMWFNSLRSLFLLFSWRHLKGLHFLIQKFIRGT